MDGALAAALLHCKGKQRIRRLVALQRAGGLTSPLLSRERATGARASPRG